MARDRNRTPDYEDGTPSKRDLKSSKPRTDDKSESETSSDSKSDNENGLKRSEGRRHSKKGKRKRSRSRSRSRSSRKRSRDDYDEDSYSSSSTESEDSTKRPEFTAWLAEVKLVNLESLPNWEEKQLFKEYYNLDAYYQRQMEKEMKKGPDKALDSERTVFNDEEQRRQELLRERERQKEEQLQSMQHSMRTGMAQAMKEQAQLREEMAYQYKLGNFEAAAAIQRRLDPDVAM
nr:RNA-binding protein 25-like [Ipomoea trifida]